MTKPKNIVQWKCTPTPGVDLRAHRETLPGVLSSACYPHLNINRITGQVDRLPSRVLVGKKMLGIIEGLSGYVPLDFKQKAPQGFVPDPKLRGASGILCGRFVIFLADYFPEDRATIEDDYNSDYVVVVAVE